MIITILVIVLIILITLTIELKKVWEILGLIRHNQHLMYVILKTFNMKIDEIQKKLKKLEEEVEELEDV